MCAAAASWPCREEEVPGFAHLAPGGTGMLKVPGKEAKSVTNPDPPA